MVQEYKPSPELMKMREEEQKPVQPGVVERAPSAPWRLGLPQDKPGAGITNVWHLDYQHLLPYK